MKRGFLICFTGIDGSGKTTLSKGLVEALKREGISCGYVYGRLKPYMLKHFIMMGRLVFLRKKNMFKNYNEYSETKKRAMENYRFLSRIYQQIAWIDYSLQILLKVKLPLMWGKNIICDRYIYDTVIADVSIDMNYSKDELLGLVDKFFHFFPKPDITFVVDLPEEVAYQRKDDVPSIDYLKERREIYLRIASREGMRVLDGTEPLAELNSMIQAQLGRWLDGNQRD